MPLIPRKTIAPELIEQIFEKHEARIKELQDKGEFVQGSARRFLLDLDVVFGDSLRNALRLIDEKPIKIYRTEGEKAFEIVELTEGSYRSCRIVRLLSNINFCMCTSFARNVLQLSIEEGPSTSSASGKRQHKESYTCHHILALRLAKILKPPSLRYENTTKQYFNFLLTTILPDFGSNQTLSESKS